MFFENLPGGVLAAGSDIILQIAGCNPGNITEVRVLKQGHVLGSKRFRGEESYRVNVSCYLKDTLDIEPYYTESGNGFKEMPSWLGYFNASATEYPPDKEGPDENTVWVETGEFPYTAGSEACGVMKPLVEMDGEIEICPDELLVIPILVDERVAWGRLSVICPDWSQFITPNAYGNDGEYRMYAYCINPEYLRRVFERSLDETFELVLQGGGVAPDVFFTKRIAVREMPAGGVRLCWVNKFGTTDYYTFSPVQKTSASFCKTRVRGNGGHEVTAVEREDVTTVSTPLLTPEELTRLSGILSSPKVWHIKENGASMARIDILTQKSEIDFDSPGTIQVSFRYCG